MDKGSQTLIQPVGPLYVAGLGRCGTTMVMHMLRAAGVPCAGTAPAFEDTPLRPGSFDWLWWTAGQTGRAVKWIDPAQYLSDLADHVHVPGMVVFLTRDATQQARSQLKLLGERETRKVRRAFTAAVRRDTWRTSRLLNTRFGTHRVLHLGFETILSHPTHSAGRLADFCDTGGFAFGSVYDAAAVVLRRRPECAPDLSIEQALIRREHHA